MAVCVSSETDSLPQFSHCFQWETSYFKQFYQTSTPRIFKCDQNELPYVRVCVGPHFLWEHFELGFYGLAVWEGWLNVAVPNWWSAYLDDCSIIDLRKLLVVYAEVASQPRHTIFIMIKCLYRPLKSHTNTLTFHFFLTFKMLSKQMQGSSWKLLTANKNC